MNMNTKNSEGPETDFPRQIGRPATGALAVAGYTRLEQLTQVTEAELLKLHGVGPKAIRILRETLEAQGMSFAKPIKP
jgi:predicted flap endonuclease-1-like 5' DNA nuclease